jgi:hypothetical protein
MRELRKRLQTWLSTLNWERERERQQERFDADALPHISLPAGDWRFSFRGWPREHRGSDAPTIGTQPPDGGSCDHAHSLRERLEEKAKKYGRVAHPVVIAVRLDGMGVDNDDIQSALYGPRVGIFNAALHIVESTGRRGEGLWRSDGRWRNRHVAGVLSFSTELRPWSVARQTPTLWLHPDPEHLLPDLPWQRVELVDAEIRTTSGLFDATETFDLPDVDAFADAARWPGEPFAHRRHCSNSGSGHGSKRTDTPPSPRHRTATSQAPTQRT